MRKITNEHNQFHENWELQYFCSKINNKIICLICISVIRIAVLFSQYLHQMYNVRPPLIKNIKLDKT